MGESGRNSAMYKHNLLKRSFAVISVASVIPVSFLAHATTVSDAERRAEPLAPVFSTSATDMPETEQRNTGSARDLAAPRVDMVLPVTMQPTPPPQMDEPQPLIPVPKRPAVILEPQPEPEGHPEPDLQPEPETQPEPSQQLPPNPEPEPTLETAVTAPTAIIATPLPSLAPTLAAEDKTLAPPPPAVPESIRVPVAHPPAPPAIPQSPQPGTWAERPLAEDPSAENTAPIAPDAPLATPPLPALATDQPPQPEPVSNPPRMVPQPLVQPAFTRRHDAQAHTQHNARVYYKDIAHTLGPGNQKKLAALLDGVPTSDIQSVQIYMHLPTPSAARLIALRQSELRKQIQAAGITANRIRFRLTPFDIPGRAAQKAYVRSVSSPHFADIRIAENAP